MIFYFIVLLLLLVGLFWLAQVVLANPGMATITWGVWSLEMKTATLVAAVVVACLLFYVAIALLRHVFGLRKNFSRYREARLGSKANRALSQGLIQLTEGNFDKAEKILIEHASYSETPLLNY